MSAAEKGETHELSAGCLFKNLRKISIGRELVGSNYVKSDIYKANNSLYHASQLITLLKGWKLKLKKTNIIHMKFHPCTSNWRHAPLQMKKWQTWNIGCQHSTRQSIQYHDKLQLRPCMNIIAKADGLSEIKIWNTGIILWEIYLWKWENA